MLVNDSVILFFAIISKTLENKILGAYGGFYYFKMP